MVNISGIFNWWSADGEKKVSSIMKVCLLVVRNRSTGGWGEPRTSKSGLVLSVSVTGSVGRSRALEITRAISKSTHRGPLEDKNQIPGRV